MTHKELKRIRKKLKLSQEGLARALDVSLRTMCRWERGSYPDGKPYPIPEDKAAEIRDLLEQR